MTNTKKCKCEKAHTLLDVLKVNDDKGIVENVQKWHKCFSCGRFQISKWIRLHEVRCNPSYFLGK